MKYIKKLNINFDDWEEYSSNHILDNFFHQTKFDKCKDNNYQDFYVNSLLINKESINDIENYLYNNNLKIKWRSNDNLIDGIKRYFETYEEISLVLGKDNRIYNSSLHNKCYNELDFRK